MGFEKVLQKVVSILFNSIWRYGIIKDNKKYFQQHTKVVLYEQA